MSQSYFPSDFSPQAGGSPTRRQRAYGLDAKIVVLGNSGVGKTSLLHRYVQNSYHPERTQATTSAFFAAKRVYVDNQKVRLQLWDTAGQERFRSMAPIYYRGANAALLLYDITSLTTFEDLKTWLQELKKNCSPDLIIYIVGAKRDLNHQREISLDRVRASLRTWFPPPRPPTPPAIIPSPTTYTRPRFTSFTSITMTPVVPFLSARSRTKSDSQPLIRPAVEPPGKPEPPPMRKCDSRPATLVRRKTTSLVEAPRIDYFSSRTVIEAPCPVTWEPKGFQQFAFPAADLGIKEEDEDSDTSDSDLEWGVQENMKLFEVSAKDDQGIQELFEHLIRSIIAKRGIIEKEKELRERDSVYLASEAPTPSWAAVADEEEAKQASAQKWTCCSV